MDLSYEIYEGRCPHGIEYTFSSGTYQGTIGQVYRRFGDGMMFFFHINPVFQGYGIGQAAFNRACETLNQISELKYIEGNWRKCKDFSYLENGCCVNFNTFKKAKKAGMNDRDAALSTTTGRWAAALGFDKVAILKNNTRRVEVQFYRSVADALYSDLSFGIDTYLSC
jgi:hypothetical protein